MVTAVSGGRIHFDAPTSYALNAGWGYFLTGSLWMLDEADEWYFDKSSGTFYVRTAADAPPSAPVFLASMENCIDLSGARYIIVDQVAVSGCQVGVRLIGTVPVEMRDLRATDIGRNAIFAPASRDVSVSSAVIERTGEEAILAKHATLGVAFGMSVTDGTVRDAGVYRVSDKVVSIPRPALGAIAAGAAARVVNNTVSGASYHGIRALNNSLVEGNLVEASCLILDDCGAIYAHTSGRGTAVRQNVVRNIPGGMEGKPAGTGSLAQGIFLDDELTGMVVVGNTVSTPKAASSCTTLTATSSRAIRSTAIAATRSPCSRIGRIRAPTATCTTTRSSTTCSFRGRRARPSGTRRPYATRRDSPVTIAIVTRRCSRAAW